jgi:hypothetical protein
MAYLEVPADKVAHIGDNWKIDFEMSQKSGFIPIFIPKTIECMENKIQNVPTNDLGFITDAVIGKMVSGDQLKKSMSYRTLIALVANEYFDDPYISFSSESDFNCSPRLMGMYPVGMHLVGLCKYLLKISKVYDSKKLILLSRDGHLPFKALKAISEYVTVPDIDYVPCSRNALLPWMVCSTADLYDLPISIPSHTPESLLVMLEFCSKNNPRKIMEDSGYDKPWEERFESFRDFSIFMENFITDCYSKSKHNKSKKIISDYYKNRIPKDSIVFDMGYSGRIPAALSKAVGYDIRYVYVCSDVDSSYGYSGTMGVEINTMYPFLPHVSGALREFFLSEQKGTCLGFESKDGNIEPVFEQIEQTFIENFAIKHLQKGALEITEKYFRLFGEHIIYSDQDPFCLSLLFECMLCNPKNADMAILLASYSDDYVYGRVERINMYKFWKSMFPEEPMKNSRPIDEVDLNKIQMASEDPFDYSDRVATTKWVHNHEWDSNVDRWRTTFDFTNDKLNWSYDKGITGGEPLKIEGLGHMYAKDHRVRFFVSYGGMNPICLTGEFIEDNRILCGTLLYDGKTATCVSVDVDVNTEVLQVYGKDLFNDMDVSKHCNLLKIQVTW